MIKHKLIGLSALCVRVRDLKNDGFNVVSEHYDYSFAYVKMIHRNGNRISVKIDYDRGILSQLTNGKQVHSETVY